MERNRRRGVKVLRIAEETGRFMLPQLQSEGGELAIVLIDLRAESERLRREARVLSRELVYARAEAGGMRVHLLRQRLQNKAERARNQNSWLEQG